MISTYHNANNTFTKKYTNTPIDKYLSLITVSLYDSLLDGSISSKDINSISNSYSLRHKNTTGIANKDDSNKGTLSNSFSRTGINDTGDSVLRGAGKLKVKGLESKKLIDSSDSKDSGLNSSDSFVNEGSKPKRDKPLIRLDKLLDDVSELLSPVDNSESKKVNKPHAKRDAHKAQRSAGKEQGLNQSQLELDKLLDSALSNDNEKQTDTLREHLETSGDSWNHLNGLADKANNTNGSSNLDKPKSDQKYKSEVQNGTFRGQMVTNGDTCKHLSKKGAKANSIKGLGDISDDSNFQIKATNGTIRELLETSGDSWNHLKESVDKAINTNGLAHSNTNDGNSNKVKIRDFQGQMETSGDTLVNLAKSAQIKDSNSDSHPKQIKNTPKRDAPVLDNSNTKDQHISQSQAELDRLLDSDNAVKESNNTKVRNDEQTVKETQAVSTKNSDSKTLHSDISAVNIAKLKDKKHQIDSNLKHSDTTLHQSDSKVAKKGQSQNKKHQNDGKLHQTDVKTEKKGYPYSISSVPYPIQLADPDLLKSDNDYSEFVAATHLKLKALLQKPESQASAFRYPTENPDNLLRNINLLSNPDFDPTLLDTSSFKNQYDYRKYTFVADEVVSFYRNDRRQEIFIEQDNRTEANGTQIQKILNYISYALEHPQRDILLVISITDGSLPTPKVTKYGNIGRKLASLSSKFLKSYLRDQDGERVFLSEMYKQANNLKIVLTGVSEAQIDLAQFLLGSNHSMDYYQTIKEYVAEINRNSQWNATFELSKEFKAIISDPKLATQIWDKLSSVNESSPAKGIWRYLDTKGASPILGTIHYRNKLSRQKYIQLIIAQQVTTIQNLTDEIKLLREQVAYLTQKRYSK
ncbi:hypothetical protein GCM10019995_11850 [Lactobacillus kefiranofaciens subsp. kefirgranum]